MFTTNRAFSDGGQSGDGAHVPDSRRSRRAERIEARRRILASFPDHLNTACVEDPDPKAVRRMLASLRFKLREEPGTNLEPMVLGRLLDLSQQLQKTNRLPESISLLKVLKDQGPACSLALGHAHAAAGGQLSLAIKAMAPALVSPTHGVEALTCSTAFWLTLNNPHRATRLLQENVSRHDNDPDVARAQGVARLARAIRLADSVQAKEALEQVRPDAWKVTQGSITAVFNAVRQGTPGQFRIAPFSLGAVSNLVAAMVDRGRLAEAGGVLDKVSPKWPEASEGNRDYLQYVNEKGRFHFYRGDLSEAEKVLREGLEINERSRTLLGTLALVYAGQGEKHLGEQTLKLSRGRWPEPRRRENPDILVDRAADLLEGDDVSSHDIIGAESLLERAHQIDPRSPTVALARADLFVCTRRDKRAAAVLGRSLRSNPGHPEMIEKLADIQVRLGRLDAADENYEKLLVRQPRNPDLLSKLVSLRMHRGQLELAEKPLMAWKQICPFSQDLLMMLGSFHRQMAERAFRSSNLKQVRNHADKADFAYLTYHQYHPKDPEPIEAAIALHGRIRVLYKGAGHEERAKHHEKKEAKCRDARLGLNPADTKVAAAARRGYERAGNSRQAATAGLVHEGALQKRQVGFGSRPVRRALPPRQDLSP